MVCSTKSTANNKITYYITKHNIKTYHKTTPLPWRTLKSDVTNNRNIILISKTLTPYPQLSADKKVTITSESAGKEPALTVIVTNPGGHGNMGYDACSTDLPTKKFFVTIKEILSSKTHNLLFLQ